MTTNLEKRHLHVPEMEVLPSKVIIMSIGTFKTSDVTKPTESLATFSGNYLHGQERGKISWLFPKFWAKMACLLQEFQRPY